MDVSVVLAFRGHLKGIAAILAVLVVFTILTGCEKLPEIANVPPMASFVYSPVSPIITGQTVVVFNASASSDADGQVVSYVWNFGDGTREESRDSPTITHVFPDTQATCLEIVYTVLLTVVDNDAARGTASQTARVTELPAPASTACNGR